MATRAPAKNRTMTVEGSTARKALSEAVRLRTGRARTPFQQGAARKKSLNLLDPGTLKEKTLEDLEQRLEEADFQYRTHLADFRWEDIGNGLGDLDVNQIDAIHRNVVSASLRAMGISESASHDMAMRGVTPSTLLRFHHCGLGDLPGGGELAFDPLPAWVRDRIPHVRREFDPDDPFPVGGDVDPVPVDLPGWDRGPDVDPLDPRVFDERTRSDVAATLENAWMLARSGDAGGTIQTLQRVRATEPEDGLQRYQVEALAPAVGAYATLRSDRPDALPLASSALTRMVPGTQAYAEVRDALSAYLVRRAFRAPLRARAAGHAPHHRRTRLRSTYEALWGTTELDPGLRRTLGREGWMTLTDLSRTRNAFIHHAFGRQELTVGSDPVQARMSVEHVGPRTWDALPSSMLPSAHRARILELLGHWRALRSCQTPLPVLPQPLFRFDYLRSQAQAAAQRTSRIEAMGMELRRLAFDKITELLEGADVAIAEVTNLVDDLTEQALELADTVRSEVTGLVEQVRDAVALAALIRILRAWPHENWVAFARNMKRRMDDGDGVTSAARGALDDLIAGEIGAILTDVSDHISDELDRLNARLQSGLQFPAETRQTIEDFVVESGLLPAGEAAGYVDELFSELDATLEALDIVELAQPILDDLSADLAAGLVPTWLRVVVGTYVLGPLVGAIITVATIIVATVSVGVGLLFLSTAEIVALALPILIATGIQYLVSAVLQLLGDLVDQVDDLHRLVEQTMGRIQNAVDALTDALADVGRLQAMLDGLLVRIDAIEDAVPQEVVDALHDLLTTARNVVLGQAITFVAGMERAHMRENLELVEVAESLHDHRLPADGRIARLHDPAFGSSAALDAAVGAFDAQLVRDLKQVDQFVTQVISLRHVLETQQVDPVQAMAPILDGAGLSFELPMDLFDRLFPGAHRVRIRDVRVHVDFDAATAEAQAALAAVMEQASSIAGELADPAMDGRVSGGGVPGSPTVPGRVPTGLPLLLRHDGVSEIRVKRTQKLVDALRDECGRALPDSCKPPALRGVTLVEDPEQAVRDAGYVRLRFDDEPGTQWFSHFSVLQDTVRFYPEQRMIKAFENRGPNGTWKLELPMVLWGGVDPDSLDLPPIRDVRLVFSLAVRQDDALMHAVSPPEVTVTEPDTEDLVPLPLADLQALLAELTDKLSELNDSLGDHVAAIDSLGSILAGLDAGTPVAQQVAGAVGSILNQLRQSSTHLSVVPLDAADLPNETDVLAGTSPAQWSVDASKLQGAGIDPAKVLGFAGAIATAVPSGGNSLLDGSGVTWPTGPASLSWSNASGGAATANGVLSDGIASFDVGDFDAVPEATGTWALQPPGSTPSLSGLMLALMVLVKD